LTDTTNRAVIVAHALAWLGTPWVRRAALRGSGADCVGLIRGIVGDVTGREIEAPAWRDEWSDAEIEPILAGAEANLVRRPVDDAGPGDVVTFRIGSTRAAHVGLLTPGGVLHASESGGVVRVATLARPITSAWAIGLADGCEAGPAELDPADCVVVVMPAEGATAGVEAADMMAAGMASEGTTVPGLSAANVVYEVVTGDDATPLARSRRFKNTAAALGYVPRGFSNVETVF
jgi:NlpC/P60 family putative phage cell wall peptidase